MSTCYHCNEKIEDSNYGRQDTCTGCHSSTHVCYNCIHFDTSQYNECGEPVAERVVDKDKANFCDYFKAGNPSGRPKGQSKQSAISAAESLFKKK